MTIAKKVEEFREKFGDTFKLCCDDQTLQEVIEAFIETSLREVEEEAKREIVICAAVVAEDGYIARGHRHSHCMATLRGMKKKYPHLKDGAEQGFITSKNRYVTRKEGYALQIEAGIPSADPGGYRGGELYSEDLY